LAIIILHAIADVCTPACLRAASIPVETVTPPTWWDSPAKNCLYFLIQPPIFKGPASAEIPTGV